MIPSMEAGHSDVYIISVYPQPRGSIYTGPAEYKTVRAHFRRAENRNERQNSQSGTGRMDQDGTELVKLAGPGNVP